MTSVEIVWLAGPVLLVAGVTLWWHLKLSKTPPPIRKPGEPYTVEEMFELHAQGGDWRKKLDQQRLFATGMVVSKTKYGGTNAR